MTQRVTEDKYPPILKKKLSKNYFRMKYLSIPLVDVFDMLINNISVDTSGKKNKRNVLYSSKQQSFYPKSIECYVEHYKSINPKLLDYKKSDILLISCVNGYIDIVYEMLIEETFLDSTYYIPLINEYNNICSPINRINPWSKRRTDKLTKDWIMSNKCLKKFPSSQSSLCDLCPFQTLVIKAIIYIANVNDQIRLVKLIKKLDYENVTNENDYTV